MTNGFQQSILQTAVNKQRTSAHRSSIIAGSSSMISIISKRVAVCEMFQLKMCAVLKIWDLARNNGYVSFNTLIMTGLILKL